MPSSVDGSLPAPPFSAPNFDTVCSLFTHGFQRDSRLEVRVVISAFRHVLAYSFLKTSKREIVASVTVHFSGNRSLLKKSNARASIQFGGGHKPIEAFRDEARQR